jgi:hypothetical protein
VAHDCPRDGTPAFGCSACYGHLKAKAVNGGRDRLSPDELAFVGVVAPPRDTPGGWHQPNTAMFELESILSARGLGDASGADERRQRRARRVHGVVVPWPTTVPSGIVADRQVWPTPSATVPRCLCGPVPRAPGRRIGLRARCFAWAHALVGHASSLRPMTALCATVPGRGGLSRVLSRRSRNRPIPCSMAASRHAKGQLSRILLAGSSGSQDEQSVAPQEDGGYGELMDELDRLIETLPGNEADR